MRHPQPQARRWAAWEDGLGRPRLIGRPRSPPPKPSTGDRERLAAPLRVYANRYERVDVEAARVSIDCESIPAKEALRLCLGPLGLTYRVRSGYVEIYLDAYKPAPYEEDPVMIAGHSLLALIAAAIGGVSAPIVAGLCGGDGRRRGRISP